MNLASQCPVWLHRRIPFAFLLLLTAFLYSGEYTRRGLWEPDEARYAYVATEMRDTGNFAVPHRNGEIYAHKPPLMFWLMQASSLLTGGEINGVAARLPSALGFLLTLSAVSALLQRWADRSTAWLGVLMTASSFLIWNKGGMGQIDSLLCGLELTALHQLFAYRDDRRRYRPVLAYSLMGLAVLAKGPVGFLVPLGAYAAGTWAGGGKRSLRGRHWIWGPLLVVLFPAAWLLWAKIEGAPNAFFDEILFRQNLDRAQGELGHVKPFTYFLTYIPLDFLPWSLFLPVSVVALFRGPPAEWKSTGKTLVGWFVFIVLLFSLSASKRNLYILAAYPAAAMLVALSFTSWPEKWQRPTLLTAFGFQIFLGSALLVAAFVPALAFPGYVLLPAGAALALGGLWGLRRYRRTGLQVDTLLAYATVMILFQAAAGTWVLPALNPIKTPEAMAAAVDPLLPRENRRILLYQMHGEIQALACRARGQVLPDLPALREALRSHAGGILIFEDEKLPEIRTVLPEPHPLNGYRMGRKQLYWTQLPAANSP